MKGVGQKVQEGEALQDHFKNFSSSSGIQLLHEEKLNGKWGRGGISLLKDMTLKHFFFLSEELQEKTPA